MAMYQSRMSFSVGQFVRFDIEDDYSGGQIVAFRDSPRGREASVKSGMYGLVVEFPEHRLRHVGHAPFRINDRVMYQKCRNVHIVVTILDITLDHKFWIHFSMDGQLTIAPASRFSHLPQRY